MSAPDQLRRLRRAFYRLYYRVKYFPFAAERRAGKDAESAAAQTRGFIVIQIDALAHDDLVRALEQGYCPRLKRLIEHDSWEVRRYPAGLPSATPAAQGAIFYGIKDDIPAFRWYEKQDRRVIVGSRPADVQYVRDRLPQDGILSGGTGYVNIYDGGSDRSYFTLSAKKRRRFLENIGGGRLFLLTLTHPIRTTRMVLASLWEYLKEEWNRLVSQARGEATHYWWYLPFLHIGSNVVLRELQTMAVVLDIYNGVPSIYTTYNVYDEFAHHFGPESKPAYASLHALDRRIGEILKMLRRVPGRPYDLYILSDHGQTPSVPYRVTYGETLGDTIMGAAEHGVLVMAGTGDYALEAQDVMDFLVQELEEVSQTSSMPVRRGGLRLGRWLRRQYNVFPLVAETVRAEKDEELVVTYSSSLAHVYWTEPARALALEEIRRDPDRRALYYFLVAHGGIGLVCTRMVDGAHVESLHGRALITPEGVVEVLSGADPLPHYAPTIAERRALARLVQYNNAGDLVLIGAYDPERDRCVCFDDQVGAHGAIGGRQFWPFIMSRRGLIPANYAIDDPLDLHLLFRRYQEEPEIDVLEFVAREKRVAAGA
ncbi:MAG: alkaline phosphatase family protein [Longimicrobiales bacterium]